MISQSPGLSPDGEVAVEIRLDLSHAEHAAMSEKIGRVMEAKLSKRDLKMVERSEFHLDVHVTAADRGGPLHIHQNDGGSWIEGKDVIAQVTFRSSGGKEYCTKTLVSKPVDVVDRVDLSATEIESLLISHQVAHLIEQIDQMIIPTWAVESRSFHGFGRSSLRPNGESLTVNRVSPHLLNDH